MTFHYSSQDALGFSDDETNADEGQNSSDDEVLIKRNGKGKNLPRKRNG